ncbi:YcxB family protein [Streptomyces uncialis]|uniref:YcxB family protein n=1 Tax=Streptomyces uncialis TaxID=1048205 RepID=UPI00224DBE88|nr:YcxB family protein [Streptomyces uncialis]MCX4663735.1 YcxB family protein [Streptomyces uncialis]WTE10761.1 YcxB family protein [Streptomyces uncialis]
MTDTTPVTAGTAQAAEQAGGTASGGPVELHYRTTIKHCREALSLRPKVVRGARALQVCVLLLAMAAGGALPVALFGRDQPVWGVFWAALAIVTALMGLSLIQNHYIHSYQRIAEHQGPVHAVADDEGIRFSTEKIVSWTKWSMYGRYAEGPNVFALFTGDKSTASFFALPKAGVAAPQDVDRLRELLDRHLRRG